MALAVPVRRDLSAEAYLYHVLVAGDQPALSGDAPVVCQLGLLPVLELLAEDSELIADGITRSLNAEGGHAVHVAGSETAETAVAEAGVRLCLENIRSIEAEVLQCTCKGVRDTEVIGILHQAAPHEELHRHIVYFFFNAVGIFNREKAAHQLTDDNGRRLEDLVFGSVCGSDAEMRAELICNRAANLVARNLTNHKYKTSIRRE